MSEVKPGDTVRIHYKGSLNDGSVFDSSEGRDPLEFTVGGGQIIPGLDKAIPGMAVGEEKTVVVPCDEAYGPVNPEALHDIPRAQIPDSVPLTEGCHLQMQTSTGQMVPLKVVSLSEEIVKVDANHPLAGEDLTFEISLVEIAQSA
ncbi:peptidylprolyl isomerase [Breoghania sp.]|uniref:FKBP-type peptidyl-prolyl cis-trans isomerase n=1 Tax=Breoghania sp. TaxID=2065378 RepID=UPI002AA90970|nr:peptidylprolyl isomerase [Breoghania sp.]